jgi:transcriptional regulator with XRE-family HTH domain
MPNTGQDLAGAMTARRIELGLSQSAAARSAGVSRPTWAGWENTTKPYDSNYAAIERVLQWERGSVSAVLAGHDPTARRDEASPSGYGIDPDEWARWDPIDREMVLNAIKVARARAAQNPPNERHRKHAG